MTSAKYMAFLAFMSVSIAKLLRMFRVTDSWTLDCSTSYQSTLLSSNQRVIFTDLYQQYIGLTQTQMPQPQVFKRHR
nr:hypothetical protein [Tanacetum cinerariifolium]